MPRPDPRRPREGQQPLFAPPTTSDDMRLNAGRHQLAFNESLNAAFDSGYMGKEDGALASALMNAAWAMDAFEAQNKPYGPTKLLDQVVAALREAKMTPDARGDSTDDDLRELLAGLGAPDDELDGIDDGTAALPHAAESE